MYPINYKRNIAYLLLILVMVILIFTVYQNFEIKFYATIKLKKIDSSTISSEQPIILVYSTARFQTRDKFDNEFEFETSRKCGGCLVTKNRSVLEKSLGVVIFNRVLQKNNKYSIDIPDRKTRNEKQFYVFWSKESQAKYKPEHHLTLSQKKYDSIFNLTMMFTRDSDVREIFGSYSSSLRLSVKKGFSPNYARIIKGKNKLAIWVVSNCYRLKGAYERMQYARTLVKAGLELDKYGACFNNNTKIRINIHKLVFPYKFYLAFENAVHCPDYVTEKFWRNGLDSGLVPVVWGPTKEDVESVAPPNSFIFAEDFNTPKELVDYLNYLDQNDEAYLEYHKWRKTPPEDVSHIPYLTGHPGLFCRLCERLVTREPKIIPSISQWMYGTGYSDNLCLRDEHLDITSQEGLELMNF